MAAFVFLVFLGNANEVVFFAGLVNLLKMGLTQVQGTLDGTFCFTLLEDMTV